VDKRISKNGFRFAEQIIENYKMYVAQVKEMKHDIIFASGGQDENVGGGRSNLPGDPTGQKAMTIGDHIKIKQFERNIHAVEFVYSQLSAEKRKLFELTFWHKSHDWDGLAMILHRDRSTLIRWRNQIVVSVATYLGFD
jgi:RinA family phage transcriptional activator